jgi:hypothetical protein
MLDTQFVDLNLHFAINLFAALVAFAVFWLIFDAWTVRHELKEFLKWSGFLTLSAGFLLAAGAGNGLIALATLSTILRLVGYLVVAAGQMLDPLQPRPVYADSAALPTPMSKAGASKQTTTAKDRGPHAHTGAIGILTPIVSLVLPLAAGLTSILYWRRATTGLERHLRPVAFGFAGFAVFELLSGLTSVQTVNPILYRLVAIYGPIWWLSLIVLGIASIILGRWVWKYLTKRLLSQLFMILIAQTLMLFLISTVGFTYLLLHNFQTQTLDNLSIASRVLQYAVISTQSETAAQAESVASNSQVISAVAATDHDTLALALGSYLATHGLTSLTITDGNGAVLLRAADPTRFGDSISSDPLTRRAAIGLPSVSVAVASGVTSPTVTLVAAQPIRDSVGNIIGTVTAGRAITGAFVDGIRASTGLEASVYGGNALAATTLKDPGGGTRAVGVKETSDVTNKVIGQDQAFSGTVSFQNLPYLAAVTPLRDVNNVPVGMLLAATPTNSLYDAANQSIHLTFLFVVALIIVSLYPVYRVAKFLARQLH